MSSSAHLRLAQAASLEEGKTLSFPLTYQGQEREGFLLNYQGELRAYVNDCPHWSVDLDLGDGDFFDPDVERIYCKNHGALFHPLTGICETGPCLGRSLHALEVQLDAPDVLITLPASLEP